MKETDISELPFLLLLHLLEFCHPIFFHHFPIPYNVVSRTKPCTRSCAFLLLLLLLFFVGCCFTSTETVGLLGTGAQPATSTFTQFLSSARTAPELRPALCFLFCCFTSTEARWLIRDGDRVIRGRKSEGSTVETARKRPERPWTAARTMEVPLLLRSDWCTAQLLFQLPCWAESQGQCRLHRY